MQYARLGNTGLIVSRLSFGAMTFGDGSGALGYIWKTGQAEASDMVARALNAGINFFDTANSYCAGQSEIMLGKALGPRRKDVVVATKVGFRSDDELLHGGLSYANVVSSAEDSLRRLATDHIDLLYIHRYDPWTPFEETARALENLIQRGLVRYVGYCNLFAWQAAKIVGIQQRMGYSPFVAAQMYYSLIGRDIEHEIVACNQDAGIGLIPWSPLAGGFLTGRYTRQDPAGSKGRNSEFEFLPNDRDRLYDLVDQMRAISAKHNATVAQVALAWLLAKPYVTSVLFGASKATQFDDNVGAANVALTPEEVVALDASTAPTQQYPAWFQERTRDEITAKALGQ
jgi:aryl-alcohol dehydrogenase-like predicted oxidoreductase